MKALGHERYAVYADPGVSALPAWNRDLEPRDLPMLGREV